MKARIIVLLLLTCGCSRKSDEVLPNQNEMKATVVLSSGEVINFIANGSNVKLSSSTILYNGLSVNGTSVDRVFASTLGFDTYAGFHCQYRGKTNQAFENQVGQQTGGSLSFKVQRNDYWEGNFNAICRTCYGCAQIDSVIVTGTFKGNYITHY